MSLCRRLLVAILALMLCASSAWADARREAKRHFQTGMALIGEGRHKEGIAELERAYELKPHAAVQYNIGRAAESLGDGERAIRAYELYLQFNPPDASAVEERINRLRAARAPPPPPPPPVASPPTTRAAPTTLRASIAPPPGADAKTLRAAAGLARSLALAMGADAGSPPPGPPPSEEPDAGIPDAGTSVHVDAGVPDAGAPPRALPADDKQLSAETIYAERAVTASRTESDVLDAPAPVMVITREEIDQSGARTVPDLLRRVPGVAVVQMTQSDFNVSVRGLNRRLANKTLVLVDGRSVYQDFLGGTAWEALPVGLEDIERIEVVKGPGAALYGASAFGGVVNIITRQAEQLSVEGVAEGGIPRQGRLGLRATGVLAGPSPPRVLKERCKPLCTLLAGLWRRARVKAAVSGGARDAQREELQLARPDAFRLVDDPTTSARSARGMASLEVLAAPEHGIRIEGGAVRMRQDLSSLASLRNYILDGVFGWAQGRYTAGPFSIRAFYNRLDLDAQPELTARVPDPLATRVQTQVFDVEPLFDLPLKVPYLGEHRFIAGAAYRFKSVSWNYLARDHTQHHFSAFLQETWRPIPQLTTVVSYRVDRHPLAPPLYADIPGVGRLPGPPLPGLSHSARAALIGRVLQTALRLSAGTAFRDPTFMESYVDFELPLPVEGAVFEFEGSPLLYPERIASLEAGVTSRAFDRLSVDASIYAMYVDRLIETRPPQADRSGRLDPETGRYVVGKGGFHNAGDQLVGGGAELLLRIFPLDGVDLDFGASTHRLWRTSFAGQPGRLLSDGAGGLAATSARTEDPPFRLVAGLRVRSSYGLEGSVEASLTGPTIWHEERLDPTSPTGVRADAIAVDPYLNTQVRLGYALLDGAVVVSAVGQNLLAPLHREHPFGDRIGPRALVTLHVRP